MFCHCSAKYAIKKSTSKFNWGIETSVVKRLLNVLKWKNEGIFKMVEKPSIFYFEFELKINNLYLPNIVFTSDEGCLDQIYSEEDNNKH